MSTSEAPHMYNLLIAQEENKKYAYVETAGRASEVAAKLENI